jgi:hypothetical protein
VYYFQQNNIFKHVYPNTPSFHSSKNICVSFRPTVPKFTNLEIVQQKLLAYKPQIAKCLLYRSPNVNLHSKRCQLTRQKFLFISPTLLRLLHKDNCATSILNLDSLRNIHANKSSWRLHNFQKALRILRDPADHRLFKKLMLKSPNLGRR